MSIRNTLALAFATLLTAFAAQAQQPFQVLNPPQPTDGGGKIEVIEFFWYGCPHCYTLEPFVNEWAKKVPQDVVFRRVPAIPSQPWAETATVFYTLEGMGLLDKMHPKVFDAMHKEKQNLGNKPIREKWLAANGVDVAKYNEMEKSFSVSTKMQRARQMTGNYKVDGVPRIYVAGKYYTAPEFAGGPERVFAVVDQLIAQARKEGGAAVQTSAPAPAAPAKK